MASAARTIDHEQIRRWAEERGGKPSHVKRTGSGDDPGMLRIDFPGFSGEGTLEEIPWEEWFDWFEKNGLALLYQDEPKSRFNKLVRRKGDEEQGSSEHGTHEGRSDSGREHGGAAGSSQHRAAPRRWSTAKTERVTINDASAEELEALWGVGPRIAERILAYRRSHGRIHGPDDLVAIDGIDGATASTIARQADFG